MTELAELAILYRGELSSCNYSCQYCPFAKQRDPADLLQQDERDLKRFVQWSASNTSHDLSVLFTPWGEALTRTWYRDAMVQLSHMDHVAKVAAQTNLSYRLDWMQEANANTFALWATYHPTEVTLDRFLSKCEQLITYGIRFSVGIVGFDHHINQAQQLRERLSNDIYLWVNTPEEYQGALSKQHIDSWTAIDPLYGYSTVSYKTLGAACHTGSSAISLAGNGDARRCHFVEEKIGNIYEPDFFSLLTDKPCPKQTCDCHIGYVHLNRLGLRETFKNGVLERIPSKHLW